MTDPQLRKLPARRYAGLRATVPMDALPATVDKGFPELFGRVETPAGPPFIRYFAFEPELDVELGVPTADGERELPAGEYVVWLHLGDFAGLVDAHARVRAWAGERGLALGEAIETYLTNPREEADSSRWQTEVAYSVAAVASSSPPGTSTAQ
jgi:effector-binding domain-containing protein